MKTIRMFLVTFAIFLSIAACSSGSSGSSENNYTELTPQGGVNINNITATNNLTIESKQVESSYTTFGVNGSTLYAGTKSGLVLKMAPDFKSWIQVAESSDPIIAISAITNGGSNPGIYWAPYPSSAAYVAVSDTGVGFSIPESMGNITAITTSQNGSVWFGTESGYVGLTNNPADKSTKLPEQFAAFGPIKIVGCSSNSCNSGQQGVIAFQAESFSPPIFESSVVRNGGANAYTYNSQVEYLDNGSWVAVTYSPNISESKIWVNNESYVVHEFVTAMTVNPNTKTAYAGTNLFNIYAAPLHCNHGQGCSIGFSSKLNNTQLYQVNNGTSGITSIAVLANGSIYAVANYSESVVGLYQSQSNGY